MATNPPSAGGSPASLPGPSRWWKKQASLEARATGTVQPSVPSACPARLPPGLSLPRGPRWPSGVRGHALALPSRREAQGQPSWTRASTGSSGSVQQSSEGLGGAARQCCHMSLAPRTTWGRRMATYLKCGFNVRDETQEFEFLLRQPRQFGCKRFCRSTMRTAG